MTITNYSFCSGFLWIWGYGEEPSVGEGGEGSEEQAAGVGEGEGGDPGERQSTGEDVEDGALLHADEVWGETESRHWGTQPSTGASRKVYIVWMIKI